MRQDFSRYVSRKASAPRLRSGDERDAVPAEPGRADLSERGLGVEASSEEMAKQNLTRSADAQLAADYDESGWCFVEAAISAAIKVGARRLDLYSLAGNYLKAEGAKPLAEALKVNTTLKELKYARTHAHAQSVSSR